MHERNHNGPQKEKDAPIANLSPPSQELFTKKVGDVVIPDTLRSNLVWLGIECKFPTSGLIEGWRQYFGRFNYTPSKFYTTLLNKCPFHPIEPGKSSSPKITLTFTHTPANIHKTHYTHLDFLFSGNLKHDDLLKNISRFTTKIAVILPPNTSDIKSTAIIDHFSILKLPQPDSQTTHSKSPKDKDSKINMPPKFARQFLENFSIFLKHWNVDSIIIANPSLVMPKVFTECGFSLEESIWTKKLQRKIFPHL